MSTYYEIRCEKHGVGHQDPKAHKVSRREHMYYAAEPGGPGIPLCQHMDPPDFLARKESVECPECNLRSHRLSPWQAARCRNTERFMGTYFRFESGMVLLLWYGEPEPEMVWDQKTRRRLK